MKKLYLFVTIFFLSGAIFCNQNIETLLKDSLDGDSEKAFILLSRFGSYRVVELKRNELVDILSDAAEVGSPTDILHLATFYHVIDSDNNINKAENLYLKIVDNPKHGYIGGIYGLGKMIFYGEGIKKNQKNGLNMIRRAALRNESNAMLLLGHIYSDDDYLKKDLNKCRKTLNLFLKLSENNPLISNAKKMLSSIMISKDKQTEHQSRN
ncbi:hypothetical protein KAJ27_06525 [bacterium]|nr:hypothetical protein [bacterium]